MSLPEPTIVRLSLIGPIRLSDADGNAIDASLRKPLSLLVYLLVSGGSGLRDELAQLFWPGAKRGSHSLRQATWQLRTSLGVNVHAESQSLRVGRGDVELDLDLIEDLRDSADLDTLSGLLRGEFCEGLDFSYSPRLEEWFLDQRDRALDRIAAAIRRVASALVAEGRSEQARALVDRATRVGLSSVELRQSIFGGLDLLPDPGATRVGVGVLRDRVANLRSDASRRLILVRGQPSEVEDELRDGVHAHPSGVQLLEINPESAIAPGHLALQLLDGLAGLPGGLGRSATTDQVQQALRADPLKLPDVTAVIWALSDALDAVLEETPLVLSLHLPSWPLAAVDMLARALLSHEGRGTLLVAWSTELADLSGPRAGALAGTATAVSRADLEPEPEAGVASASASDEVSDPRRRRRRRGTLLAIAAVPLALVGVALWSMWGSEAVGATNPDADLMLCSAVSGQAHLYHLSYARDYIERVSGFAFAECIERAVWVASLQRLYVSVQPANSAFARRRLVWFEPGANLRSDWNSGVERAVEAFDVLAVEGNRALDDRWLALSTLQPEGFYGLAVLDLQTSEVSEIANDLMDAPEPVWQLGGRRLLWNAPWQGRLAVWSVEWPNDPSQAPLEIERLVAFDEPVQVAGMLGDSLLVERGQVGDAEDGSLEIGWVHLMDRLRFEPVTVNEWNDHEATLSPDGRRICWTSEAQGHYRSSVHVLELESGRELVLDDAERTWACRFSPSGRDVFVRELRNGRTAPAFAAGSDERTQPVGSLPGNLGLVGTIDSEVFADEVLAEPDRVPQ